MSDQLLNVMKRLLMIKWKFKIRLIIWLLYILLLKILEVKELLFMMNMCYKEKSIKLNKKLRLQEIRFPILKNKLKGYRIERMNQKILEEMLIRILKILRRRVLSQRKLKRRNRSMKILLQILEILFRNYLLNKRKWMIRR